MIQEYLSANWPAFGTVIGNHLWQSTLFAVVAGLLTIALRKNHARARYWLWLTASVKFLFPFSLLIMMGTHLSWFHRPAETGAGLYLALDQAAQPFGQSETTLISRGAAPTASSDPIHLLPVILAAVWLCGFATVVCVWYLRWRTISAVAKEAQPMLEGREVELLRRAERKGGIRKQIELRLSRTSLEPGIFGILKPVLVWPEGISGRLEDAHLEAVLAHELWHVRRRDNLAAALHMVVEAIFWFHPLVWWIGDRQVEERERACDEAVLESGGDRKVYAESILKICEFCVGSPLVCVSGVTGADLKKRIVNIMSEGITKKLDFSRKLLLGTAGLLAVAAPIVFGLLHATPSLAASGTNDASGPAPGFASSSIKPSDPANPKVKFAFLTDSVTGTNITLQMVIRTAYRVEDAQVSGGPSWVNSEKYDFDLKMDQSTTDKLQKLSDEQRAAEWFRMVRTLLEERFKLVVHREKKEVPGFVLVISESGSKLHEAKPGDTYPNGLSSPSGPTGAGTMRQGIGKLTVQGLSMVYITRLLTAQLGHVVVDKTGLTGKYDFALSWTPDESQPLVYRGISDDQRKAGIVPPPAGSGPSIYAAIQEQLGLKLQPQTTDTELLVIDRVEVPTAN